MEHVTGKANMEVFPHEANFKLCKDDGHWKMKDHGFNAGYSTCIICDLKQVI